MYNDRETYDEYDDDLRKFVNKDSYGSFDGEDEEIEDLYDYEFDNSMNEIDFSQASGRDFKKSFSNVSTKLKSVIAPEERKVIVQGVPKQKMFDSAPKRRPQRKKQVRRVVEPQKRVVERFTDDIPASASVPVDVPAPARKRRKNRPAPVRKQVFKQRPGSSAPRPQKDIEVTQGKFDLMGRPGKKISDVIVPTDRPVIVKGASDFIVSQKNDQIKNIGYYKGKKLKELILTFNNNSAVDFEMEVFNPSMPLAYLYSTAQNLNDKVQVAGGAVSYTDVLFNLLANPTFIPNCKFVFAGPSVFQQKSQALKITNSNIAGVEKIQPLNLDLQVDTMQVASDIVFFDLNSVMNRPFIPDGMDVIKYTVLAGMSVTMAFFYEQVSLKKVFYKQARKPGIL